MMSFRRQIANLSTVLGVLLLAVSTKGATEPIRVFIFAGQSNMLGADSRVDDIALYPPFVGLHEPQPEVRFWYCLGREQKTESDDWSELRPVNGYVGPELSFARELLRADEGPVAIIKCAAGGTHLGGDWNPDDPQGFQMYPLMIDRVKRALERLREQGLPYRLEGVMWHQGENDMFNEGYLSGYGPNLARLLERWRGDLGVPDLRFYIGELCTKTIWGMDLRPRMAAITRGQRFVTDRDGHATFVPTSHVGVEIGEPVGLHYHYGTLGQLEHGVNYAAAYLRRIGKGKRPERKLAKWPYQKGEAVTLFVLAGHRNMEGERAFSQELGPELRPLAGDNGSVAFRYSVGGGYRRSTDWEPLGPVGFYDTFGPELVFGKVLSERTQKKIAVAKFTHSGSQLVDWTPDGSEVAERHVYPAFISFVRAAVVDLEDRGHEVSLAGIFYHLGENETSMPPYRRQMSKWLAALIRGSRSDLGVPELPWVVSQQEPTNHKSVNGIDVVAEISALAEVDAYTTHLPILDFPRQRERLVLDTRGVLHLGKRLAEAYLGFSR